jgi:hypothetical protein
MAAANWAVSHSGFGRLRSQLCVAPPLSGEGAHWRVLRSFAGLHLGRERVAFTGCTFRERRVRVSSGWSGQKVSGGASEVRPGRAS